MCRRWGCSSGKRVWEDKWVRGAVGTDEVAAVWATQLSREEKYTPSPAPGYGVRLSTCISRLDSGHRRNTGLIQNVAAESNLKHWLSFLLFPTLLSFSFLSFTPCAQNCRPVPGKRSKWGPGRLFYGQVLWSGYKMQCQWKCALQGSLSQFLQIKDIPHTCCHILTTTSPHSPTWKLPKHLHVKRTSVPTTPPKPLPSKSTIPSCCKVQIHFLFIFIFLELFAASNTISLFLRILSWLTSLPLSSHFLHVAKTFIFIPSTFLHLIRGVTYVSHSWFQSEDSQLHITAHETSVLRFADTLREPQAPKPTFPKLDSSYFFLANLPLCTETRKNPGRSSSPLPTSPSWQPVTLRLCHQFDWHYHSGCITAQPWGRWPPHRSPSGKTLRTPP